MIECFNHLFTINLCGLRSSQQKGKYLYLMISHKKKALIAKHYCTLKKYSEVDMVIQSIMCSPHKVKGQEFESKLRQN
jgi:hypothetical protein